MSQTLRIKPGGYQERRWLAKLADLSRSVEQMYTEYLDREQQDEGGRALATAGLLLCVSERSIIKRLASDPDFKPEHLRPIVDQKIKITAQLVELPNLRPAAQRLTAASLLLSQQTDLVEQIESVRGL